MMMIVGKYLMMMPHIRYLEFYAGIGGWRMALQKAVDSCGNEAVASRVINVDAIDDPSNSDTTTLECCAAFDHSDLCTAVYQHNFAASATSTSDALGVLDNDSSMQPIRIENLTMKDLMVYHADIWMMSPPCQPHTRQHNNQENDVNDKRSNSFLHLCELLNDMETTKLQNAQLPSIILLENVVGFESSNSCTNWIQTLHRCNYRVAQFHLQPTQVGVPNDRPRYYCVAIRNNVVEVDKQGPTWMSRYFSNLSSTASSVDVKSKEDFNSVIHTSLEELGVIPEDKIEYDSLPMLTRYIDSTIDFGTNNDVLRVSESLLQRPAAWCLDIVAPSSRRSSCFTSAYGKYAKGTGSVILQKKYPISNESQSSSLIHIDKKFKLEDRQYDPNWAADLIDDESYLRYFSGTELTRLFGFSDTYTFPTTITMKQQWKLVGNSLNVNLTMKVVEFALRAASIVPERKSK